MLLRFVPSLKFCFTMIIHQLACAVTHISVALGNRIWYSEANISYHIHCTLFEETKDQLGKAAKGELCCVSTNDPR